MMALGRRAFLAALVMAGAMPRVGSQSFSIDDFLALSSRLTGQASLDRDLAGIYLKTLLATPGITSARLARPDTELERDIIVTWYTGVHRVLGEAQLVTHTGALQWRAIGVPAHGTCSGPFGAWATPHQPGQA
jgi:hypothetical protein